MAGEAKAAGAQDKIIGRVKGILLTPQTEWPVIAAEPATVADIYKNYLIIVAALPAIATFLKASVIGTTVPLLGTFRVGMATGLTQALMSYVLSLVMIYVVALIIDALAPTFGGTKNQIQAVKTSAYAWTASLIGGILVIVPAMGGILAFLAMLYGFYLLYLGLPVTMQAAKDKAAVYTAAVAVCAIVLMLVVGAVMASVTGLNTGMTLGALSGGGATNTVQFDPNSTLGQLGAYGQRLEQAGQQLDQAQQSGDDDAAQAALGNLFGAAIGGNANVESLSPDQMRALVPESLGGLNRTEISAERNAMFGIQVSQASARYSDGAGRDLSLEIMDLGGAAGLTALAGWANIEQDRQTGTGYERTRRANGQIIHEVWDSSTGHGEYSVIVGNRFSVEVQGNAQMNQLQAAVNSIDLARLTQLGVAR